MSIWQRIFGPPPDNGDRMVRIPADVVAAVAEVTDRPGKYILDAVRQRLRRDYEQAARDFLAKPPIDTTDILLDQMRRESEQ